MRRNQQDQPHLLKTNPLNYDNYLYFTRAPMKFYNSTSADFSFQAPKCQDSFRYSFRGIILLSNPPMSVYSTVQSGYNRLKKHGFLTDCVSQMLQKEAIYHLKDCTTPGFYSRLFLVPKPGKKWCPVIDLSVLGPVNRRIRKIVN